mgnify:CR=1 FL=1
MEKIDQPFPSPDKKNKQKERMRNAMDPDWEYGVNMIEMLRSEKYRLKFAIRHSADRKQACELLGISRWTYDRWLKKYNVKGH